MTLEILISFILLKRKMRNAFLLAMTKMRNPFIC